MESLGIIIGLLVVGLGLGFAVGWLVRTRLGKDRIAQAEQVAEGIIRDARREAEQLRKEKLLEAEEYFFQERQKLEREEKQKFDNYKRLERQLSIKESNLDRKVDILNKKEKQLSQLESSLKSREKQLNLKEEELNRLIQEQNRRLEQISGLTSEEAKKIQLENILQAAREEAEAMIREIQENARQTANERAQEIIMQAIQRTGLNHIAETTVSIIKLPNDDMKGRIIGREGRNIRTFEATTGIEVLIDDTPEVVMLSGFNPVRREIAKIALEKLISDGRIHPGRIEEVVEKTREEIEEKIFEYGEQAVLELGLHGIHHELVKLLGKLKFHTSQGQNVLQHSMEVAQLAGQIAAELELDTNVAKRAGLLHEVGVAIENYTDCSTSELSAELVRRYGESEKVQEAVLAANKPDLGNEILSPISVVVATANQISKLRPGAQKEMLENYIQRLNKLEEIANSFIGVVRSYALQAGREIRVMVEYSSVDDAGAEQLATAIAKKIRENTTMAGQIKVTVIREYRTVDYAK